MNSPILWSTLLLTLLLSVGLFFFIRASTKDRTQTIELVSTQPEASLMAQLQQYLQSRSYTMSEVDAEKNSVTFEGFVRPSLFLAIFLSSLAAVGILCLTLVWSFLFPDWTAVFSMLILLAPGAGVFYWKKARRKERVWLKVEATGGDRVPPHSLLTVTAHRDELIQLQRSLQLKPTE
jgi:Flp pilus assembly protein TadB